ncbi:ATPase WRNIP1-like [Ipomoea triloba]|uniref:ATPase WRNIP1-like n=1 Tax=Ipomoea triloba TaxID=35885 RepID=UPI00125CD5FA|nr:ATPase WRNIP1-like [Ipomoea triloba]
MTNQNEKPPTNHKQQQHIDRKRKNVNNNDNAKSIRINPKHEDMLDLCLWSPNHSANPSSFSSPPTTPTPSQWQLSLSPLSSQPSAHPPPQQPNPNPSPPSSPQERAGEGDGEGSIDNDNDNDDNNNNKDAVDNDNDNNDAIDNNSETIVPPYEWATDRPAIVHTLDHLLSNRIEKIKGEVKCKRCECEYEMELDLRDNFSQLEEFIWENKDEMYERAPEVWTNPTLPRCRYCHQDNSAKPVISRSQKAINWLFLLLGQLLGCCTLVQLRYFCKHTKNHRTGAKDRLLYLAYLTLCKQLRPTAPFHR